MPRPIIVRQGWTKRANAALDSLLFAFSIYGVPIAIGALSLVALLTWNGEYATSGRSHLEFRVFEQTGETTDTAQALKRLEEQSPVDHLDTRLSESPFWFEFTLKPAMNGERAAIELPSRHALAVSCWDTARLNNLGSADRAGATGGMKQAKTGFVLVLRTPQSQARLIGVVPGHVRRTGPPNRDAMA